MLVIKPENVGLQVVDSIDVTYSSRPKFSLVKCFRNTVHFLFSQVGLCALVLLYALVGAVVFRHLEQTNEVHECKTKASLYEDLENQTITSLWLIAQNERPVEKVISEFRDQLRGFLQFVAVKGVQVGNVDECNDKEAKGDWTFADALLFSVTVFTTIGYGNIAPKTFWGRLVCICYAMLGIPLMLLCLGNLATVLGDAFRYVYSQVLCCGCCVPPRGRGTDEDGSLEKSMKNLQVSVSPEQWMRSYEAVKAAGQRNNCSSASSRPGPESQRQDDSSEDERTALRRSCADQNRNSAEQKPKSGARNNTIANTTSDSDKSTAAATTTTTTTTTTTQNLDDKDDDDKDEKIGIPLTISLGLIAAYLLFGAVLFCFWERDWAMLDAAYYCFVTISTVGFGDLVPGAAGFHSDGDGWRMVGASLYMLVGMALLSMCFNLIQDEIAAKCIRLGQLVGLIDK